MSVEFPNNVIHLQIFKENNISAEKILDVYYMEFGNMLFMQATTSFGEKTSLISMRGRHEHDFQQKQHKILSVRSKIS